MKVFLDTEFIAGFHKPLFGKRRHFIDLISIGLVDDTGRTYYAISKDFDPADADEWVKANVLAPLVTDWVKSHHGDSRNEAIWAVNSSDVVKNVRTVQRIIGKTNKQIADDVRWFVYGQALEQGEGLDGMDADVKYWLSQNSIEFYAYYADYDWVLFCSLFGRMIDLPEGFPMYCRDLKQQLDERGINQEWKRAIAPDPEGEHNALVDAQWNKLLHDKIEKLSKDYSLIGSLVNPAKY